MADPLDAAYELRSIDRLIAAINMGGDNEDASRALKNLMETLKSYSENYGGKHKAQMTIKLEFVIDPKGLDVTLDFATKQPARPKQKERLFLSENSTLTARDPARGTFFEGHDLGRHRAKAN